MLHDAGRWFAFAEEDLQMADLAAREGLWNQACFHSQQAAEKFLKGTIAKRETIPPRTHKLVDLSRLLGAAIPADLRNDLILLDRFYIPTRYPDVLPGSLEDGMPNKDDAQEAQRIARLIKRHVYAAH